MVRRKREGEGRRRCMQLSYSTSHITWGSAEAEAEMHDVSQSEHA
jgi:hypothetical protein